MNPRYFASEDRLALYRLRLLRSWVGEYRRGGTWVVSEDVVRRYWNGFDADVREFTEEQAMDLMAELDRRKT